MGLSCSVLSNYHSWVQWLINRSLYASNDEIIEDVIIGDVIIEDFRIFGNSETMVEINNLMHVCIEF
jgi:hypothetical protein